MPKEVMDRRASDNEYLHKDFHGALSSALIYLEDRFGPDAVREYLREFARKYYAPLREDLAERGLEAIADRLRRVYEDEGADVCIELDSDGLIVEVEACPAVTHMREHGYEVSPMWRETIRSVNEGICEGSAFDFELLEYHEETGASRGRFFRRNEDGEAQ
jgi:predicted ArsR family transcriptional regulator